MLLLALKLSASSSILLPHLCVTISIHSPREEALLELTACLA